MEGENQNPVLSETGQVAPISNEIGTVPTNEPGPAATTSATPVTPVQAPDTTKPGDVIDQVQMIPMDQIIANPNQPRKDFNQEALEGLASNIKQMGLLSPIIVSRKGADGKHIIIAGERRFRAMGLLKANAIKAIVRDVTPDQMYAMSASENLARQDMTPYEEAMVYRFYEGQQKTAAQIGQMFGKHRTHITNMLGLLDLPKEVVDELSKAGSPVTMGHARALKGLKDHPAAIATLFKRIMDEGVSVRFVEEQAGLIKKRLESGASLEQVLQGAASAPKNGTGDTHPRTAGDGVASSAAGGESSNGTTPTGSQNGDTSGGTAPGAPGTQMGAAPTEGAVKESADPDVIEMQKVLRTYLRSDVRIVPNGEEFYIRVQAYGLADVARLAIKMGLPEADHKELLERLRSK